MECHRHHTGPLIGILVACTLTRWAAADALVGEAEASLSLIPSFEVLDVNKDGFVNKEEVETQPAIARRFQLMDINADQKLDSGEFARLEALTQSPPEKPSSQ